MKLFLFLLISIQIFSLVYSAQKTLIPAEYDEAKLITNNDDPCSVTSILICGQTWSTGTNYSVINILLNKTIEADYTKFKNLISLEFGKGALPPTNFWTTQINTLKTIKLVLYGDESIRIPSVYFQNTLTTLIFYNFYGTYYSTMFAASLQTLIIENAFDFVFEYPTYPTSISYLRIPMPSNGLSKLDEGFPILSRLDLNLNDIEQPADYSSQVFGTFNLKSLMNLNFGISSKGLNNYFSFPDFSKLTNLYSLSITGEIFKRNQTIDLSNSGNKLIVNLLDCGDTLLDCDNCLKLPENNKISIINSSLKLDQIDLSNSSSIELNSISTTQTVSFNNMNFKRLTKLSITQCNFNGDLPDDLCLVLLDGLFIKNNLFNGKVPSCFLCTDNAEVRDHILPNDFENFDESTPINCPNFKIEALNESYTGDSSGYFVEVKGTDLGFDIEIEPDFINYMWNVQNEGLIIIIPAADSTNINNKNVLIKFLSGTKQVQISYGYDAPYITGYYIRDGRFNILGHSFNTIDSNLCELNNQNLTCHFMEGYLEFSDINPINILNDGQEFTIKVFSNGMQSNKETYVYFINEISIDYYSEEVFIQPFNNTGGRVVLSGSFLTTNSSGVIVNVCDLKCNVKSISKTSLTFTYPKLPLNQDCSIYISIFGNFYETGIQVVENSSSYQESSSSSSSSSQEPSNSLSESNSESSDQVSSSLKLNINSLFMIFLLFSIILI